MIVTSSVSLPACNPFSARCIQPGALRYRTDPSVFRRLETTVSQHRFQGAIVGPHGSGKSTLAIALMNQLGERLPSIRMVIVTAGKMRFESRQVPALLPSITRRSRSTVRLDRSPDLLIVDGFDSLGWLARQAISSWCWTLRARLLVTSHRSIGLPVLLRTKPSAEMFLRLARDLQRNRPTPVGDAALMSCYQQAQGNLREAFFLAYDVYERKTQSQRAKLASLS